MTIHDPQNEDLTLTGLEPGDDNPLEYEPTYNPLRHCYLMLTQIDEIEYQLAVKFQLQEWRKTTPIDFIDPKTNKPHSINFFPRPPEISLEPTWSGPNPDLHSGYQIGENPYYLVPTLCRCKHIKTGQLLSRNAATKLITPDVLQTAIIDFRDHVENDPNAPVLLAELLDMWDPAKKWQYEEQDDTWDWDEDDD